MLKRAPGILLLAISTFVFAQQREAPKFDVVSVKPARRGGGPYSQVLPGRLSLNYYSVPDLVALAYGVRIALQLHRETRQRPVYELRIARAGSKCRRRSQASALVLIRPRPRRSPHEARLKLPSTTAAIRGPELAE